MQVLNLPKTQNITRGGDVERMIEIKQASAIKHSQTNQQQPYTAQKSLHHHLTKQDTYDRFSHLVTIANGSSVCKCLLGMKITSGSQTTQPQL